MLSFSIEHDLTAGLERHFRLMFLLQIIVKTVFFSPPKEALIDHGQACLSSIYRYASLNDGDTF